MVLALKQALTLVTLASPAMARFLNENQKDVDTDVEDIVNKRLGRDEVKSKELDLESKLDSSPVSTSFPRLRNLRKKRNVETGIDDELLNFIEMKIEARSRSSRAKRPKVPPLLSPPAKSPSICDKRLEIAFDALSQLGGDNLEEQSDVTNLCNFFPAPEEPFNFGCPIFFTPDDGFLTPEFFQNIGNELAANAYNSLTKYCSCYQGYELGCAGKIPHGPSPTTFSYGIGPNSREVFIPSYSEYIPYSTPASRAEYCKFASVWNGDISPDDFSLSKELGDCGCFFVTNAKEMLSGCPGLDLGAFYDSAD